VVITTQFQQAEDIALKTDTASAEQRE